MEGRDDFTGVRHTKSCIRGERKVTGMNLAARRTVRALFLLLTPFLVAIAGSCSAPRNLVSRIEAPTKTAGAAEGKSSLIATVGDIVPGDYFSSGLFVMGPGGGGARVLDGDGFGTPTWSPDGARIVYERWDWLTENGKWASSSLKSSPPRRVSSSTDHRRRCGDGQEPPTCGRTPNGSP